ncbi:tubulin-like doman-containing protein [Bacillus pacificus]
MRVIIVTSLAGGTGSGMFLQIALYLREMLRKKTAASQHFNTRCISNAGCVSEDARTVSCERVWKQLQANGYASLKELHAITLGSTWRVIKTRRGYD